MNKKDIPIKPIVEVTLGKHEIVQDVKIDGQSIAVKGFSVKHEVCELPLIKLIFYPKRVIYNFTDPEVNKFIKELKKRSKKCQKK